MWTSIHSCGKLICHRSATPYYKGAARYRPCNWYCNMKAHRSMALQRTDVLEDVLLRPQKASLQRPCLITHTEAKPMLLSNSTLVPLCLSFRRQVLCEHFLATCVQMSIHPRQGTKAKSKEMIPPKCSLGSH